MTSLNVFADTIDVPWWRRFLIDELLPRWRQGADNPTGLFHAAFDRQWRRKFPTQYTLVSQSRLIYNFCVGYEFTGAHEYMDAVVRGADALLRHFQDREQGGWFWSCDKDGQMLDAEKNCYGHAFVVFSLANAARITDRDDYRQQAHNTWGLMKSRFRDSQGGFAWRLTRDFHITDDRFSQNPMMHTFEALLALAAVDNSRAILSDAAELWGFIAERLICHVDGTLPEFFTLDWLPVPSQAGGVLDIGHAFEWAFLLSQAAAQAVPIDGMLQARRFLEYGVQLGYDSETGGIISPVTLEGHVPRRRKGWWEQCEAIRAMVRMACIHHQDWLGDPLKKTVDFFHQHFLDGEYGGLYLSPPGMGANTNLDKGNQWKVDYHLVGMCAEIIRRGNKDVRGCADL